MSETELLNAAEHEANWLKYYTFRDFKKPEYFKDCKFYNVIQSIGYAKVNTPLDLRCMAIRVTSTKPVLESTIEELIIITNINRNHDLNVYSALEYVIGTKHSESQKLIDIITK